MVGHVNYFSSPRGPLEAFFISGFRESKKGEPGRKLPKHLLSASITLGPKSRWALSLNKSHFYEMEHPGALQPGSLVKSKLDGSTQLLQWWQPSGQWCKCPQARNTCLHPRSVVAVKSAHWRGRVGSKQVIPSLWQTSVSLSLPPPIQ